MIIGISFGSAQGRFSTSQVLALLRKHLLHSGRQSKCAGQGQQVPRHAFAAFRGCKRLGMTGVRGKAIKRERLCGPVGA